MQRFKFALSHSGPLSLQETLHIGLAVGHALQDIHGMNILHLGLKPTNVLLTVHDEPLLSDLRISNEWRGLCEAPDDAIRRTHNMYVPIAQAVSSN